MFHVYERTGSCVMTVALYTCDGQEEMVSTRESVEATEEGDGGYDRPI